jgi:hypothetical protein
MANALVGNATYQCLHCRLAQRAEVRTIMLPHGRGASQANTTLATLLALKHCPRCGHYDRQIEAYHRNTVRVGLIGYAILAAIVAVSMLAIPAVPGAVIAVSAGVFALGFVALAIRLHRRFPTDVERRVQLLGSTAQNQRWF